MPSPVTDSKSVPKASLLNALDALPRSSSSVPSPPLRDRDGAKEVFRVTVSSPRPARMAREPEASGASKVMAPKELFVLESS